MATWLQAPDSQWQDARRVESWAGEVRVNLIRLVALIGFYAHHLINVYLLRADPTLQGSYHAAVTVVVLAWGAAVGILFYFLRQRIVPSTLKYVATLWDIALITGLLVIGGNPKTELTTLYYLVVVAASLRFSLPLVYVATLASMAAYLLFMGYIRFTLELPAEARLDHPDQVIFLLTLGGLGLLTGQLVRQAHRLVQGYSVVVVDNPEA